MRHFVRGFVTAVAITASLSTARPAAAQHPFADRGPYDPAVPRPSAVLGYEVGERFTPHHMLMRYIERVAAASPRIRVDTLGRTFEGREVVMVIATSEANHRRLAEIRADARRLAHPAELGGNAQAVIARSPAIVWLGFTVHGGEASGTEASIALLYQLAAGQGADTRRILDSTVVLIDPVENPDGHERHAQDVMRRRGALGVQTSPFAMIHQGSWPGPRTSHYVFDLNRDWFILSHPETRARVGAFTTWWPHVAADLHEMGSNSTYFFAPPMAPVNRNVHASIYRWWDIFAAANAAAFDARGTAYFRREGYDEFFPGYGVSWPILTGAVGMTYEQASSAGGAIQRRDGTVLTLHEAASNHYTTAWATIATTAARRAERVRDYVEFRREAGDEAARAGMRAVVIERDADGRADSLARRLIQNGIDVRRLGAGASVTGTAYGDTRAGTARLARGGYVVDIMQPQGRLAKALLEPDAQLDSAFIREELERRRTGLENRFYDVTAWALPYSFRVKAWVAATMPAGSDAVTLEQLAAATPAPARSTYAYAFAPGSEAALRTLAALLRDSVRVSFAQRSFRSGDARFPRGAFVVRVAANGDRVHDLVRRHAQAAGLAVAAIASGAVDEGTDLGSNSVLPVTAPRVALLGGPPMGNSFGFAWFALDQRLAYPSTPIEASAIAAGALADFDVLIVPSAGNVGSVIGAPGQERLQRWVRDGGVLITLGESSGWLATESVGLARLRTRRDSVRADSAGGAALPANVPGAIVRALADTLSPLLAGVEQEFPVLMFSSRIYTVPRDLRAGEAVVRYAPEARLRLAGYMWPEVPARLAESPYLWTESVGRGRVIAFTADPNFRDAWRGLLPLFANAVFLGGSF